MALHSESSTTPLTIAPSELNNPLLRYSLTGTSKQLAAQLQEQQYVLDKLALTGQATVIFAPPNTGKTLLTLNLLCDSISKGLINPAEVYYFNMDDSAKGLVEKLSIAEDYCFEMISEGHNGFNSRDFLKVFKALLSTEHPKGMVVFIDTIKKVVDPMKKSDVREFTSVMRAFVLKGGTVIGLAHTNKNTDGQGELKYAGTSDLVDDFDCAYIIGPLSAPPAGTKGMVLKNIKRRGDVAETVAYTYSSQPSIPYEGLMDSVQVMASDELIAINAAAAVAQDSEVIQAIEDCIRQGVVKKMLLAQAAATRAGIGRRAVIDVLERYGASNPQPRWAFKVGPRGANLYYLIEAVPAGAATVSAPDFQDFSSPAAPGHVASSSDFQDSSVPTAPAGQAEEEYEISVENPNLYGRDKLKALLFGSAEPKKIH